MLVRMQEVAAARGGKCLSESYLGAETLHAFECARGHRWESLPRSVAVLGCWCNACKKEDRWAKALERLAEIARSKGGYCLSVSYLGPDKKLLFQCALGHRWEAKANNVASNGCWCPKCAIPGVKARPDASTNKRGRTKDVEAPPNHSSKDLWSNLGSKDHACDVVGAPRLIGRKAQLLAEVQELARSRGGRCLSMELVRIGDELVFECSQGHQWLMLPRKATGGSWCSQCRAAKDTEPRQTLESALSLAEALGWSVAAPRPWSKKHRVMLSRGGVSVEITGIRLLSASTRGELVHLLEGLAPDPSHQDAAKGGVPI